MGLKTGEDFWHQISELNLGTCLQKWLRFSTQIRTYSVPRSIFREARDWNKQLCGLWLGFLWLFSCPVTTENLGWNLCHKFGQPCKKITLKIRSDFWIQKICSLQFLTQFSVFSWNLLMAVLASNTISENYLLMKGIRIWLKITSHLVEYEKNTTLSWQFLGCYWHSVYGSCYSLSSSSSIVCTSSLFDLFDDARFIQLLVLSC